MPFAGATITAHPRVVGLRRQRLKPADCSPLSSPLSIGVHQWTSRRPSGVGILFWLSPEARTLITALIARRGTVGGAELFARQLGYRNRHQLARTLDHAGLPPLETLARWIRVLLWVRAWERSRMALSRGALEEGEDYAVRFRVVRQLTGCRWTTVRSEGAAWVAMRLREQCRQPGPAETTEVWSA